MSNRQKGLRRLAIAIAVPYFGWWAFFGVSSYIGYGSYQARINSPAGRSDIGMQVLHEGFSRILNGMAESIIWGIFVPLIAILIVTIILWVYRGFRPKA